MKINNFIFGEVQVDQGDSSYVEAQIELNGRESEASLYLGEEFSSSPDLLKRAEIALNDLEDFDWRARSILLDAADAHNETVVNFIDFHLEEVLDEVELIMGTLKLPDPEIYHNAVKHLIFSGVALHVEHDDNFVIVMDYMLGTDEILCVTFDEDGEFINIAHES